MTAAVTPPDFTGAYTDEFVEIDGLRLHYTDWNPDGERHVVLVHGLNVQSHTWDPIAVDLARDYHVVSLDLRGHGESDWARDGYYIRNFVADLAGLVERLGLPAFELVTHSLGCRIGIAYAAEHPDLVRHLMLSDAGPEFPREASEFTSKIIGAAGGDTRGFSTEEQALEFYRSLHPEWQPVFHELHVRHQLRRNWAGKLVFRADPDLFWLTGSAGKSDDAYVWECVARLTVPTLILWGERSPFFNEDIAGRMLERMSDGRLVRTNTGHYIPREAPEEFLRHATQFLDT